MDEARLVTMTDTSNPSVACMYDYVLGGRYNSAADRAAMEAMPLVSRELANRWKRSFAAGKVGYIQRPGVVSTGILRFKDEVVVERNSHLCYILGGALKKF